MPPRLSPRRLLCLIRLRRQVSMLGVVPSLVKAWQSNGCTDGVNWSCVRRFGSTGEASSPAAMLWLMSQAWYKPVIEYCGTLSSRNADCIFVKVFDS